MPAWENDAALAVAAASMAAIDHLVARASSFVVLSGGSKLGLPSVRTAFEISALSNEVTQPRSRRALLAPGHWCGN